MEVRILKLITGETLVSEVEDQDTHYLLKNPAMIAKQSILEQDGVPSQRNVVEPFAPHVKGHSVYIGKSKVIYTGLAIPSLETYYKENYAVPGVTSSPVEDHQDYTE